MQEQLLALTLRPPWGFSITWCWKDIENRNWRPESFGLQPGQLFAIHAGKMHPPNTAPGGGKEWREIAESVASLHEAGLIPPRLQRRGLLEAMQRCSSAIVAVVTLERVSVRGSSDPAERSPWRTQDEFGWVLSKPVPIVPVPCEGHEKLWKVSDKVREMVRDRCMECPSCKLGWRSVITYGHTTECELMQHWSDVGTDPLPQRDSLPVASGVQESGECGEAAM